MQHKVDNVNGQPFVYITIYLNIRVRRPWVLVPSDSWKYNISFLE